MSQRLPAPLGEVIDRSSAISFTWNGKKLQGFEGDTIASAPVPASVLVPVPVVEFLEVIGTIRVYRCRFYVRACACDRA